MDLDEMQAWLVQQIQKPRALTKDDNTTQIAARLLTGNDRLLPVEQLEIYRQQFWLRHSASLVEDFPGLGGILGQQAWEGLVEGYLATHPPQGWTLRDLGRDLPAYVELEAPDLPHRELCTDMARLEWRFIELFDAGSAPPLNAAKLASVPPELLQAGTVRLHPALALLQVRYPVAELRRQLVAAASSESDEAVAIPQAEPQCLVLYRGKDLRLYHRPVPAEAFALLEALQAGMPLVAACEHTLSQLPGAAQSLQENVAHWFRRWGERGWIVDIEPSSTESALLG